MTSVEVPPADDLDETDRRIIRELRQRIDAALARLNDGQAVVDEATLREVVHEQVQAYQRWARVWASVAASPLSLLSGGGR